jgi:hypothetical protein
LTLRPRRRLPASLLGAGLLATLLTACGGGGGGGGAPTPATLAQATPAQSSAVSAAAPAVASAAPATPSEPAVAGDCGMFPASAIFNTRIDDTSRFPALAQGGAWIAQVGSSTPFFANWGTSSDPADLDNHWGLPVNTLDAGGTQWPVVSFDFPGGERGYAQESDCATSADGASIAQGCSAVPAPGRRFPFPAQGALVENTNADHHLLVVDRGACRLWEAYGAQQDASGQWYAMSTATWDLRSNALRPDGWGSADAAGLPITPLLARASEASTGEIRHALRVTFRDEALSLEHAWPARFAAGGDNPGAIPFGSLLRLKADFVIPDSWSPQAKAVALAAKRYGLYVADNGPDFYVQGEPSGAWDPAASQQLRSITLADMEFVDLGAITRDARFNKDSMQAAW